jgi:hypothetical protein
VVAATEINQRGFTFLTLDMLHSPHDDDVIASVVLGVGTAFQDGQRREYNRRSSDAGFVCDVLPFVREGLVKTSREILLVLLQKIDGKGIGSEEEIQAVKLTG